MDTDVASRTVVNSDSVAFGWLKKQKHNDNRETPTLKTRAGTRTVQVYLRIHIEIAVY